MRFPQSIGALVSTVAVSIALASQAMSAPITYGNIAVTRVGDGSAALTGAGTAVFLDEYTTSGTLVQSIALPTTTSGTQLSLVGSGSATSDLGLQQSGNGRYLTFGGYNGTIGQASIASSTAARVAARVDLATGTIDTSTSFGTTNTGNNMRGVYTQNGTDIYGAGGASGVFSTTFGATANATQLSSTFTNARRVSLYNGQLYASSGSGTNTFRGINAIGTGTPTTAGQTVTRLPGFSDTASNSSYDFVFASPTTMYVSDDASVASGGGVQKWVFDGTNWVKQYTGTYNNAAIRAVSYDFFNPGTLYGIAVNGTDLVRLVDNGTGFTATSIATAATNTAFRGLAVVVPEANTAALAGLALPILAGAVAVRRRK